jgi:hypothetical protein
MDKSILKLKENWEKIDSINLQVDVRVKVQKLKAEIEEISRVTVLTAVAFVYNVGKSPANIMCLRKKYFH